MPRANAFMLVLGGFLFGSAAAAQHIQTAAATIADRLNGGPTERRVAVVDFVDVKGAPTELGRFLAEELSVALAGSAKKFVVIDRTYLQALIQEHKLSASGLVDPQTARKLGQIAGADTLVTGISGGKCRRLLCNTALGLAGASRGPISHGRSWALPVLAQEASARAAGLRPRGAGQGLAVSLLVHVAFRLA